MNGTRKGIGLEYWETSCSRGLVQLTQAAMAIRLAPALELFAQPGKLLDYLKESKGTND